MQPRKHITHLRQLSNSQLNIRPPPLPALPSLSPSLAELSMSRRALAGLTSKHQQVWAHVHIHSGSGKRSEARRSKTYLRSEELDGGWGNGGA
jgi:hypothetical protein